MKRIFLASMLVSTGLSLMAQSIDRAKSFLEEKKLPQAKAAIDKTLENPKRAKDAETWYVKAKIYATIANDSAVRGTVPDAREQAFEALKQYVAIEKKEDGKFLQLQLEQYKPAADIYYGYYTTAAAFYNTNNFSDAFINFKKCLEVGDYVRSNDWKNAPGAMYSNPIDTNVVLFTGIAAEKTGNKDTAAAYYAQIADRKIKIDGMLDVCKWLTNHYYEKQDKENTQKYINLGKELYPDDTYWTSLELEIASNNKDKATLYKKYDEMIAKEPENYIFPYNYGIELYKEAYETDSAKRSASPKELIPRAEAMIRRSLELKPDYLQANLVLGQILYNQAVEFNTQQRMLKLGVPVSKLTPEDIKQKEDLKAEMIKKFDEAIPYLEKVGNTLSSQGKLKGEDKNLLKSAYDLLTTIYDNKQTAKDLPEDQKQAFKKKMEEYQDKFNSVDKIH
ncbi:MAG TPA: hypothetical protein VJ647_06805 [Chitinophagaceae bacterium]|nr:hypothetical protein [Chitinophagaceae bacterium]